VLKALQDQRSFDAREADLVAGTSAGAICGVCLRAGLSPTDLFARQVGEPASIEGQELLARIVTPYSEGRRDNHWTRQLPQSPIMGVRALVPVWAARPVHGAVGLMPPGNATTEALGQRLDELLGQAWPDAAFWVPAVRLRDGERVVFGRDDVDVTVGEAVRASCAVPGRYEPVTVSTQRYVDGGVHSSTNADLMGPPAFDAVVVSSVMTGDPNWSEVGSGLTKGWSRLASGVSQRFGSAGSDSGFDASCLGNAASLAWSDGRALRAARRQWMHDKLQQEVKQLRNRGIAVLVVEPDAAAVEALDGNEKQDPSTRQANLARLGYSAALAASDNFAGQLRRAHA